jgi:hypothetical protein
VKIVAFVGAIRAVDNAPKRRMLNHLPLTSKITSIIKLLWPNHLAAAPPAAALGEETLESPSGQSSGLSSKGSGLKRLRLKPSSVKLPRLKVPGKKGK